MKKSAIVLIVLGIIILLAALTNPKEPKHEAAIKESLRSGLSKSLKANGVKNNEFYEEMTGSLFENVLWDKVMEESVSRNNYFLFSTSKLNYLGKEYTAGLGLFGMVWVFPQVEEQTAAKFNQLIKEGGGLKKSLGF